MQDYESLGSISPCTGLAARLANKYQYLIDDYTKDGGPEVV